MSKRIAKLLKGQMASSVFYIILGLCLVLMPVRMVDVICKVVFGIVLIGAGVYHIVIYVKGKINATLMDMFSGVLLFVLGGFLFFNPQIVVKLLPVLLGAFVLIDSIWTLQGCAKLKNRNRPEWQAFTLISLVFVVLGIVLVLNPFSAVKTTVIFAGWVLLCNGILDVVFLVFMKKEPKMKPPMESEDQSVPDDQEAGQPKEVSQLQEITETEKTSGEDAAGEEISIEENHEPEDRLEDPKSSQTAKLQEGKASWNGEILEEWKDD